MKYIIAALLLCCAISASAQTEENYASSALYLEIAGNGGAISANYEWRFLRDFSLRAGLGYFTDAEYVLIGTKQHYETVARYLTIPVVINYLLPLGGKNNIQIGVGGTMFTGTSNTFALGSVPVGNSGIFPTASIGFRRQPKTEGFMIEAALTPFYVGSKTIVYSAGLGFGYIF